MFQEEQTTLEERLDSLSSGLVRGDDQQTGNSSLADIRTMPIGIALDQNQLQHLNNVVSSIRGKREDKYKACIATLNEIL